MLLAGRKLTAMEAKERGLVSEVFPHDDFWREVNSRVNAMAKLPPKVSVLTHTQFFFKTPLLLSSTYRHLTFFHQLQSLQYSKKLMRDAERAKLYEVNDAECELLEERWLSEECMQAVMQFMSRRQK